MFGFQFISSENLFLLFIFFHVEENEPITPFLKTA